LSKPKHFRFMAIGIMVEPIYLKHEQH
jgi:hypothetical protein